MIAGLNSDIQDSDGGVAGAIAGAAVAARPAGAIAGDASAATERRDRAPSWNDPRSRLLTSCDRGRDLSGDPFAKLCLGDLQFVRRLQIEPKRGLLPK